MKLPARIVAHRGQTVANTEKLLCMFSDRNYKLLLCSLHDKTEFRELLRMTAEERGRADGCDSSGYLACQIPGWRHFGELLDCVFE